MIKNYEYTYLTRQDMSEDAAQSLRDKIAQLITDGKGIVVDTPRSYKKRLAYPIKKQEIAFVNTIMFTFDAAKINEFKKEIDKIPEILRGLIVTYDPKRLAAEKRREPRFAATAYQENKQPLVGSETSKVSPQTAQTAETIKQLVSQESSLVETENKAEKSPKNKKESKTEKPVKTAETKPKRRPKVKTELKDIEKKLDEILK